MTRSSEGRYSAKGKAIARNKRQQPNMQGSQPARSKSKLGTYRERNRVEQENHLRNKKKELASPCRPIRCGTSMNCTRRRSWYGNEWCNASGYKDDYNVAHPVFDHPVLQKHLCFNIPSKTLLESMRDPSPHTDSLASATPIIQLEFDRVGARLGVQGAAILEPVAKPTSWTSKFARRYENLAATLQAQNDRTASELKDLKRCIGNNDKLTGNKRQYWNKDAVRSQLMQPLKSTVEAVVAMSEVDEVEVSDDFNGSVAKPECHCGCRDCSSSASRARCWPARIEICDWFIYVYRTQY